MNLWKSSRRWVFAKQLILGWLSIILLSACQKNTAPLFSAHSSKTTNISFSNEIHETAAFNIIEYIYMYNGGGVAAGDLNNDGWVDLYFTSNQGLNRLYVNQGNLKFQDVTNEAGVGGPGGETSWTTGVTLVDINADGWLDIYVCQLSGLKNISGKNRLYINNGGIEQWPSFKESAAEYNLDISTYSQHAAFFDYDKDGDLDMYLVNQALHSPDAHRHASLRQNRDPMTGDRLFRNEDGKFEDVSESAGIFGGSMGYGLAVSFGDINNDSWPDIYVSNDFHENDYLYYNNCNGTFRENLSGSFGHVSSFSMGSDIADFNNDGWLDLMSLDMKPPDERILKQSSGIDPYDIYRYKLAFGYHNQYARNMLQMNVGPLFGEEAVQYSEIGQFAGVDATDWSWSVFFADFNNSGKKDLFITNGIPKRPNNLDFANYTSNDFFKEKGISKLAFIDLMPAGKSTNIAYENSGSGFDDVSESWGLAYEGFSNGAVPVDLDNDGDLDIVVSNLNNEAIVFENHATERTTNNFLKVKLYGNRGNNFGIGARVVLETSSGILVQENFFNKGWISSVSSDLHFGLGEDHRISKLTVDWPDGTFQELKNPEPNTTIGLNQTDALPVADRAEIDRSEKLIKDVSNISGIDYTHRENFFIDFSTEKLMPRLLSTEGPPLAVGDLNGDGLDDFFIGGAKGQHGSIYLQQSKSKYFFLEGDTTALAKDRSCEDVGAVFADIDNDGDLDLFVVSGGSEPDEDEILQDRIYLNDGLGRLTKSESALPPAYYNGSCVVAADFTGDGHIDFFVGGRSTPHEYGFPGVSSLFVNNGNGTFSDRTSSFFQKDGQIGLVTDALWREDTKELITVGEWMPITIFSFHGNNTATVKTIPNSSGWWNAIHADDLDNDGDLDFLIGNQGLNTNLSASPAEPLDLYLGDYDGNLKFDPVIAYYKNDQQWIYPGLDQLAQQIQPVKKTFRTYEEFANSSFKQIFPEKHLEKSLHVQVQTLASVWMENRGFEGYEIQELPNEAQYSPIYGFATYDFDADGLKDVISVGNFHGNQPRMGRCDASFGTFLHNEGNGKFTVVKNRESGFSVSGESRSVKILHTGKEHKLILVARNNANTKTWITQKHEL